MTELLDRAAVAVSTVRTATAVLEAGAAVTFLAAVAAATTAAEAAASAVRLAGKRPPVDLERTFRCST